MITVNDIKTCSNMHRIPKSVHINKNITFDWNLFQSLTNPDERCYKYDFDVYLPTYGFNLQRDYVWEHYQQNDFIMSILLEKPIDPIIAILHNSDLEKRSDATMQIIDGKQRLLTIKKFANNEFPVDINGKEVYFKDFDNEVKRFFESRVDYLIGTIYYSYDDCPLTDDMKIILFNFYNFAGTPQTEEHKNKLQTLIKDKI